MKTQSPIRRYMGIAICIVIFISAISTILLLNIKLAKSLQQDTQALVIISKQHAQLESLIKYSYNINRLALLQQDYSIDIDLLHSAFRQFDETLESMAYGAQSNGPDQRVNQLLADKAYLQSHQGALQAINDNWQQYRKKLSPLANAYFSDLNNAQILEKSTQAIAASDNYHLSLESSLLNLSAITDEETSSKLQKIRVIQIIGIGISLASFTAIIGLFFSQVRRTDQLLTRKETENREILSAVSDGLLLIDKQLIVGEQTSRSLEQLLPAATHSGQRFSELLKPYVSPETLKTTEEYIDILFSEHVEESLVQSLNPLQETLLIIERNGERIEHYIDINFVRTWHDNQISHVLVSLRDITANVQLKQQLQQKNQQQYNQQHMLMVLLKQDPHEILETLQRAEKTLHTINRHLQQPSSTAQQLKELALNCLQNTHRLKGEFATLQLEALTECCQVLEEHFSALSKQPALSGEDFITAVIKLEQLLGQIDEHRALITALASLHQPPTEQTIPTISWEKNTETYLHKIAAGQHKQIACHWQTKLLQQLPSELARDMKTIITQTLRNAVHHGIESASERRAHQKPTHGQLYIQLEQQQQGLQLCISDDGKGFDLSAVKNKLLAIGDSEAQHYSDKQLLAALFRDEVSTAATASADAGQGAGLALVASLLAKHHGKVNVRRNHRELTQFHYHFPAALIPVCTSASQELYA